MAQRYDSIRTASWLPASHDASLTGRYRALPFPEQWRGPLLALCNTGRDKPLETVPTFRMDQVIQTLAPDVLVRPRPSTYRGENPDFWLYAPDDIPDPLPTEAFRALVGAWLKDLRPEREYRSLLSETCEALFEDPPEWQEGVEVELLRCPPAAGGTAAPDPRQFQLTTDWLARRLLKQLEPYDYGAGRLRFRAMPRGPRDQGAELVSQALKHEGSRGSEWFSVVLNITLQTVPFDPLPRFHLHTHIRRYATRVGARSGQLYLPYGRRTTVLLRPRVPWLPGAPASERFALARLAWDKGGHDWVGGGPAGMLRSMSLTESFPDAASVLTAPAEWLGDEMRAAVVHSTAMGSHEVGTGLMPDQRSRIVEWAEEALPAQLRPAPALVHTRLSGSTPANPRQEPSDATKKAMEERQRTEARRKGAAFALRCLSPDADPGALPLLETRLFWQTPAMRDTAVAALIAHLGLKGDGGAPEETHAYESTVVLEWQTPELMVRLHCRKLTRSLGHDLALPEASWHSREAVTTALGARRREMAAFVAEAPPSSVPSLALVEIDRAADFTSPDHDAKFAVRLGCADAGVLTQFMAVPKKAKGYNSEKNKDFRAAKAWDDGLRQLGVRVHPEHSLGERLPSGMRYAAVWMVRKNRRSRTRWAGHVPVAVLVTPEASGQGLARVEGWDDEGRAWVPYPVMLLRLTRRAEVPTAGTVPAPRGGSTPATRHPSWWADMAEQRRATEEWMQRVRRSLRGTPTMLLAHGQNMRSHWTWLQDSKVVADKFRDGHAPARRLDPDLRLVRVRTSRGRETAQWWGVNPDGANGLAAHLWTAPTAAPETARVFWSTTPKARTFKLSVAADKLAPRVNTKGKLTVDTDKAAWNPGLVELTVLGCHPEDDDSPEALALAVHQLRQAPDLPDALSLPLPLHLAGLAQEYVLPTRAAEDVRPSSDATADASPDAGAAPGLEREPEPHDEQEQLALFDETATQISQR